VSEAPLFVQSLDLAGWLHRHFQVPGPLGERIHRRALDLVEAVTLALKDFDREEQVERADVSTAQLRVLLRLALDVGQLREEQFVHVAGMLDGIGRQIGGWQRRLGEATLPARRR
jgi:hypothetical protein